MTTVVRGATLTLIPKPRTTNAGKNVVQYDPPIEGTANSAKPVAAIIGPTISGSFEPYRVTRPPDQRERKNMSRMRGSAAAPAAVAEYPCTWIRFIGKMKKKMPSAA